MPRRPLDYYDTPPHYVEPLLDLIGSSLVGARIYEPCVGQGHISRFLLPYDPCQFTTNDIDPSCPATTHTDARIRASWPEPSDDDPLGAWRFDWTITNPPFSDELEILQHALSCSTNVAFLARLSFLEPTLTREALWCRRPPTGVIVLPRYSFRQNDQGKRQTDSVTCCWLIWREWQPPCLHFSRVRACS